MNLGGYIHNIHFARVSVLFSIKAFSLSDLFAAIIIVPARFCGRDERNDIVEENSPRVVKVPLSVVVFSGKIPRKVSRSRANRDIQFRVG